MDEPIDNLHKECLEAMYYIRGLFFIAKNKARNWVPKPYRKEGDAD